MFVRMDTLKIKFDVVGVERFKGGGEAVLYKKIVISDIY